MKKHRIKIEYCVPWNYHKRAASVADDLLKNYQHIIEELTFVTSSGGAFEVTVDDDLIFSKKTRERRHAEPGEILGLFQEIVGPEVAVYGT